MSTLQTFEDTQRPTTHVHACVCACVRACVRVRARACVFMRVCACGDACLNSEVVASPLSSSKSVCYIQPQSHHIGSSTADAHICAAQR